VKQFLRVPSAIEIVSKNLLPIVAATKDMVNRTGYSIRSGRDITAIYHQGLIFNSIHLFKPDPSCIFVSSSALEPGPRLIEKSGIAANLEFPIFNPDLCHVDLAFLGIPNGAARIAISAWA
jgi:hypothetical protein